MNVGLGGEGNIVHVKVEKGRGEYRPLGDSVSVASCCGWDAIVYCVCMSSCKIVGKPSFVVHVDVGVEYLLCE